MSLMFIDIETVREVKDFDQLNDNKKDLFRHKFRNEIEQGSKVQNIWDNNAGLYAEFAKIVCISMALITTNQDGNAILKVKSISSRFEDRILKEFVAIIEKGKIKTLVGHNIIEFDVPFLRRRMITYGIPLPMVLDTYQKKPWELTFDDTMEMWGSPAWKYRVSLSLLAECLGLPNPKEEMSGASVAEVYYGMFDGVDGDQLPFDKEAEALAKISTYCNGDVIVTANCYRRMKYLPIFEPTQIVIS